MEGVPLAYWYGLFVLGSVCNPRTVRAFLPRLPHLNKLASRIGRTTCFLAHLTPSALSLKWILRAPWVLQLCLCLHNTTVPEWAMLGSNKRPLHGRGYPRATSANRGRSVTPRKPGRIASSGIRTRTGYTIFSVSHRIYPSRTAVC